MQLNKYLALCGVASRRKANDLIASRRVKINGKTAERLGMQVREEDDTVSLDGKILHPARRFRYVLLNKPADAVTTVRDDQGRKTVLDLVGEPRGLYPVGRLDLDTEGVLLLTNDGELAHRLSHPRYEIDKLYRAWVPGPFGDDAVKRFRKGVVIEDGFVARGEAQAVRQVGSRTLVEVRIHEGKKRQVRRMFQTLGFTVRRLARVNFGGLTTRGLAVGEWRDLKPEEIRMLYRATGLSKEEGSSKLKRDSGFRVPDSGSKRDFRIRKPFNPKPGTRKSKKPVTGSGFRVSSRRSVSGSEKDSTRNMKHGPRNAKPGAGTDLNRNKR
jgi:23S rRNA pseudouridine2605 synthase